MACFSFKSMLFPILVSIDKISLFIRRQYSLRMIHVLNENHTIIFLSRLRHERLFTATNAAMEVKLT